MRLADVALLQRTDTEPWRAPKTRKYTSKVSSKPPLTSMKAPQHVKTPSEMTPLPRPHMGYVLCEEAVSPKDPSSASWKTPDSSSKLWRRRNKSRLKQPEAARKKRDSDIRTLGVAECDDADDDFILYLDLHGASLSETARQLSRMVQGKVPSNQRTLEQSIYEHLSRITKTPGTAADAEQRVDRIMAQSQVNETWHFYVRQRVQNSDAVSKIDNLPDDPTAKAQRGGLQGKLRPKDAGLRNCIARIRRGVVATLGGRRRSGAIFRRRVRVGMCIRGCIERGQRRRGRTGWRGSTCWMG